MNAETNSQNPLHSPLDEYERQFAVFKDDARQLTEGLSHEQFNWSPAPEKWSIAQCLVHLNSVDKAYAQRLDKGIEDARERGLVGDRRVHYGFLERFFIRLLEPPPRRRLRAPRQVLPAGEHPLDEVVERYLALKDELVALMNRANGLDLMRVKIVSPMSKLVKFRLGAVFAVLAAHERRHLWQARRVRQHGQFPTG